MKLLLTQLRVLRLLLGVLEAPAPPPAAPPLRPAAVAEARSRWRELKGGYGGVVGALGGAVPPTLSQLGRGRGLLRRIRRAVRPPRAALSAEVQRRRSRVVALRERAAALRGQTEERRRALRAHREAASRGGARCRLLQALSGLRLLPGPEVELGPPPGASDPPPALRVRGGPDGELSVVGGPPPLPPPLCPGLLELQSQLWAWGPLWGEVRALQSRFALDWEPQCGRVRAVGPPASPVRSVLRHVQLENLAAGLSGGVVSTLVLHPLDLVKIRFAVSDGLELRPKYNGILHCMTTVWKREGLRGLYQGVTPNMVGAGASWGLYFFFYNAIKAYKKEGKLESLTATEHLVSAAEAGAMTLCITNPIWVTKTRLVLQYDAGVDPSKRQYTGMSDALIKIYKTEGIRGLYKGFVPGLFGTSHGALQFMAYEDLKQRYNKYRNRVSDTKLNTAEYIMMAAVSKIFAVTATYPYQVVRARLQDQHNRYSGVLDVICRTWRKEGIHGFYKGIVPNVIRVTPACCITFVVYENVSGFLLGFRKENN